MSQPLVSIVVPSYNHSAYVTQTIQSVLSQTLDPIELIVIDDGSTDGSPSVIQNLLRRSGNASKAKFIARANVGLCPTLNEGLNLARGKYFAVLASDDTWEPTKLERQVAAMEASGDAASFTDCHLIDAAGNRIGKLDARRGFRGGNIYRDLALVRFLPPSPTSLFRRDELLALGGYDETLPAEDFNIWIRVARKNVVTYLDEPLASYRVHGSNMSTTCPLAAGQSARRTIDRLLEDDATLRPYRRRMLARAQAHYSTAFYGALKFSKARAEAVRALLNYPFDTLAWQVLLKSSMSPAFVHWLRSRRSIAARTRMERARDASRNRPAGSAEAE